MTDGSISAELHRFFAAYFHEDWDLEADDWDGIVDGYAADHPAAEHLRLLARELDNLRQARPESELEHFLVYTVGMYYWPKPLTYNQWLGQVAERLRQCAAGIDNSDASQS
ncbi:contact-dependent growth inhibition system immunity protein [Mycobacterium sp. SMC-4]|uniref:contact-dependent growth inhibition system immunity protein n=1 Tax=Mycobacterium sp. SMC-4 TaxID=2857059 RepID=UPI003D05EBD5